RDSREALARRASREGGPFLGQFGLAFRLQTGPERAETARRISWASLGSPAEFKLAQNESASALRTPRGRRRPRRTCPRRAARDRACRTSPGRRRARSMPAP